MNRRNDVSIATAALSLGLVMLAAAASPVLGRTSDRQQEAEIDAGHWLDDPEQGVQIFSRGVTLIQGTLKVEAQKATVYRSDAGGFDRILLEGNPARWNEQMDDGGCLVAQAGVIDYNLTDEMVVLRTDVVVNKQRDEISGELIRYNLTTQRLDAGGDGPEAGQGRVRMRLNPNKPVEQTDC